MKRSIRRYETILNEMETHNIYETQKLDRLQLALHTNLPLTTEEKMDVEHLKQDSEELRLTKRKAIYLKKGILLAKAKLAKIELIENANKEILFDEADYSSYQRLPGEFSTKIEFEHPHAQSFERVESKFVEFACRSPSNLAILDSNDEADSRVHSSKINKTKSNGSVYQSPNQIVRDSVSVASRASTSHSHASALSRNSLKGESATSMENAKLELESSKSIRSIFKMPKCASSSCFYPLQSPTSSKSASINTPYLNQYDSHMKTSHTSEVDEKLNDLDPTGIVGIKKVLLKIYKSSSILIY